MMRMVVLFALVAVVAHSYGQLLSSFPTELGASLKQDLFQKLQRELSMIKDAKEVTFLRIGESSSKFSSSGFVYQSIYAGSNGPDTICADPSSMYGEAVNSCFPGDGFAYKFQILTDSCSGAIVQFFADADCKSYMGSMDLSAYEGKCEESKVVFQFSKYLGYPAYQSLKCTTSAAPILQPQPFKEPSCDGLDEVYHSRDLGGRVCSYTSSVGYYSAHNCSTSSAIEFSFKATSCSGAENELTALCYPTAFIDDDLVLDEPYAAIYEGYEGYGDVDEVEGYGDDPVSAAILALDALAQDLVDDDDSAQLKGNAAVQDYSAQKYGAKHRGLADLTGPSAADSQDQAQMESEEAGYTEGASNQATYFLGFCTAHQGVSLSSELIGDSALDATDDARNQGRRLESGNVWVGGWQSSAPLNDGAELKVQVPEEWPLVGAVLAAGVFVLCVAAASLFMVVSRKGAVLKEESSNYVTLV